MNIIEFIKKTPKAELHLHIEGTLEPDHMFALAKRNNIQIPFANVNEVKFAYNFSNLESFLKIFYEGSKVLVKEQDFFDLTWAYALKCKENNVVHTEIFFDPQTHINRGINFDTVINGIYKALQKANKEFGLTFEIIMCFLRHLDETSGFEMLDQASTHKEKIVGVGLDSSEIGNPPSKFKKLFKKRKNISGNFPQELKSAVTYPVPDKTETTLKVDILKFSKKLYSLLLSIKYKNINKIEVIKI